MCGRAAFRVRTRVSHMPHRRRQATTFIERVLEGRADLDDLSGELDALAAGDHIDAAGIAAQLGVTAGELSALIHEPRSLRYLLHARRFSVRLGATLRSDLNVAASEIGTAAQIAHPDEVEALVRAAAPVAAIDA